MQSVRNLRRIRVIGLVAAVLCWAGMVTAATVRINYSTDTSGFFGTMNPLGQGAQARAALDAAAAFYSGILDDTLAAIQTPAEYHGTLGGKSTWAWKRVFSDPATGLQNAENGLVVPANDYIVFVGARNLGAGELGRGGPGGGGWTQAISGNFTPTEQTYVDQTQAQFKSAVETRGETSGFARWGGSVTFDSDTNWHFDPNTAPAASEYDFYSVALHELGHTLGFGASTEWDSLVSGATFVGPQAMAQYFQNGPVPIAGGNDGGHWSATNTGSTVYGGTASQQPVMVPALPSGVRRRLTNLDAAALVDIGWEIDLPQLIPGDYNRSEVVDAADYTIWRNTLGSTSDLRANGNNSGASAGKIDLADYNFWKSHFGQTTPGSGGGGIASSVPEPAAITLLLFGWMLSLCCRRRLG